jgi:hypothetical protein
VPKEVPMPNPEVTSQIVDKNKNRRMITARRMRLAFTSHDFRG